MNSRFSHGVVCQSLGAQTSLAASPAQPHPVSSRRHAGAENNREAESPHQLISIALQTCAIQTTARHSGVLSLWRRAGKQSAGHAKHDGTADALICRRANPITLTCSERRHEDVTQQPAPLKRQKLHPRRLLFDFFTTLKVTFLPQKLPKAALARKTHV